VTAGFAGPADGLAPSAPELARLTPAERSLLREYLRRRSSLEPTARAALAGRVAPGLAGRIGREIGAEGADGFLVRLADEVARRPSVADSTSPLGGPAGARPRRSLRQTVLTPLGVILLGAVAIVVVVAYLAWPEDDGETVLRPTPCPVVVRGTPRPRPTALPRF
jgi:hypothetical protein